MSRNTILLGVDPGFASFGYAALCIAPDGVSVRCDAFGVFETEKSSKKLSVLATEDNLRRAREIGEFLEGLGGRLADDRNVLVAVCAEAMSWPRNAAATAKIGITWGVIAEWSRRERLPILQASPQMVKKAIAGAKTATKEEVQAGVLERVKFAPKCGEKTLAAVAAKITKGRLEHPFDALAVALTCSKSEAVNMARRSAA